jgi:hypothetical protein
VLFNSKYFPGLLCFYGGYLDGKPQDPSLGGRLSGFLQGHFLLKWPACPHWKHVIRGEGGG